MSRSVAKIPPIVVGAVLVIVALLCGPSSARAGDDALHFSITPYLWLPSVDNHLDVKGVPVEFGTNTNSFDILGKLDFALLVAGEARIGRFGLYYDFRPSSSATMEIFIAPLAMDTTTARRSPTPRWAGNFG